MSPLDEIAATSQLVRENAALRDRLAEVEAERNHFANSAAEFKRRLAEVEARLPWLEGVRRDLAEERDQAVAKLAAIEGAVEEYNPCHERIRAILRSDRPLDRRPTDEEVARVVAAIEAENPCRGWVRPAPRRWERVARAAIRGLWNVEANRR